ncbi:hypothetical protein [Flavobacterium sp. 11]|uniref:hypothetical protein n=1 Tax=Flavobacterium sp. 11 TaxID=357523 RepID=UPI00117A36C1|nr:hypothetical protein [Flavobacterium sp. 11]
MIKQIYFLLIISLMFGCQKQEKIDTKIITIKLPKRDKNNIIGFACFYAGTKSEPVKKISEILKNKNYTTLKAKLYDVNPAEKYLATVACEKLETKKLIKLTEQEFTQIKINKESDEKVTLCGGCTNEEELTLKEMFTSKENFLADSVEEWINEMIK